MVRERPKRDNKPKEAQSARPRNVRVSGPGHKERVSVAVRGGNAARAARARLVALGRRLKRPLVVVLRVMSVVVVVAGTLAMGKLLQHHLTTSKAFAITSIDTDGLSRLDREELLEAAGIDLGTNVFLRSAEQVRARLLAHPWVASAEVTRRLPGHFSIRIREREPVALLAVEACSHELGEPIEPACDDAQTSSIYLVSDEGTVFKRLDGEDPVDLPVITGIDRRRLASDPEIKSRVLLEAVALLSEYREAGLLKRAPIGELHLEPTDGFSLYAGDDLTLVRLGLPPFGQKLRRMRKVFDRLQKEHASAQYVYLDNEQRPDRVTVRLR